MKATFEGDLKGGEWVMRYDLRHMGRMERRPVARPPEKPGVYFVDFGTVLAPGSSSAALFIDGAWLNPNKQPFKATVTHWTRVVESPAHASEG